MLNELKDLAQKKSKAEKVAHNYIKKKEEEKIRKNVRSDKLEEFFEPVTKAIEKIPETKITPQVGQLVPAAVPVPNIMDTAVPLPQALAIEEPEGPQEPQAQTGRQIVEMPPGGVNISKYDAEEQLDSADLSHEEKISRAKGMNVTLGKLKSEAEFPQDIKYLQNKNKNYYQKLQGKKLVAV